MKTLLLSTALAAGLAGLALTPASAGALAVKGQVVAAPLTSNVACRDVERRTQRNGVTRIERTRECDGDRRAYRDDDGYRDRRYVDRRDYRRDRDEDRRPGINFNLGN